MTFSSASRCGDATPLNSTTDQAERFVGFSAGCRGTQGDQRGCIESRGSAHPVADVNPKMLGSDQVESTNNESAVLPQEYWQRGCMVGAHAASSRKPVSTS